MATSAPTPRSRSPKGPSPDKLAFDSALATAKAKIVNDIAAAQSADLTVLSLKTDVTKAEYDAFKVKLLNAYTQALTELSSVPTAGTYKGDEQKVVNDQMAAVIKSYSDNFDKIASDQYPVLTEIFKKTPEGKLKSQNEEADNFNKSLDAVYNDLRSLSSRVNDELAKTPGSKLDNNVKQIFQSELNHKLSDIKSIRIKIEAAANVAKLSTEQKGSLDQKIKDYFDGTDPDSLASIVFDLIESENLENPDDKTTRLFVKSSAIGNKYTALSNEINLAINAAGEDGLDDAQKSVFRAKLDQLDAELKVLHSEASGTPVQVALDGLKNFTAMGSMPAGFVDNSLSERIRSKLENKNDSQLVTRLEGAIKNIKSDISKIEDEVRAERAKITKGKLDDQLRMSLKARVDDIFLRVEKHNEELVRSSVDDPTRRYIESAFAVIKNYAGPEASHGGSRKDQLYEYIDQDKKESPDDKDNKREKKLNDIGEGITQAYNDIVQIRTQVTTLLSDPNRQGGLTPQEKDDFNYRLLEAVTRLDGFNFKLNNLDIKKSTDTAVDDAAIVRRKTTLLNNIKNIANIISLHPTLNLDPSLAKNVQDLIAKGKDHLESPQTKLANLGKKIKEARVALVGIGTEIDNLKKQAGNRRLTVEQKRDLYDKIFEENKKLKDASDALMNIQSNGYPQNRKWLDVENDIKRGYALCRELDGKLDQEKKFSKEDADKVLAGVERRLNVASSSSDNADSILSEYRGKNLSIMDGIKMRLQGASRQDIVDIVTKDKPAKLRRSEKRQAMNDYKKALNEIKFAQKELEELYFSDDFYYLDKTAQNDLIIKLRSIKDQRRKVKYSMGVFGDMLSAWDRGMIMGERGMERIWDGFNKPVERAPSPVDLSWRLGLPGMYYGHTPPVPVPAPIPPTPAPAPPGGGPAAPLTPPTSPDPDSPDFMGPRDPTRNLKTILPGYDSKLETYNALMDDGMPIIGTKLETLAIMGTEIKEDEVNISNFIYEGLSNEEKTIYQKTAEYLPLRSLAELRSNPILKENFDKILAKNLSDLVHPDIAQYNIKSVYEMAYRKATQ